jgi:hypothetical protein
MWAANESNLRDPNVETTYLAQLKIKTGFEFLTAYPTNPPKLAVRSVVYVYPPVCNLTGAYPSEKQSLELNLIDFNYCVKGDGRAQNHLNDVKKEIWVVVP